MKNLITALLILIAANSYSQKISRDALFGKWKASDPAMDPKASLYFSFSDTSFSILAAGQTINGKFDIENSDSATFLHIIVMQNYNERKQKSLIRIDSDTLKMQDGSTRTKWELPETTKNTGFFIRQKSE